jgi:hypothetical protein
MNLFKSLTALYVLFLLTILQIIYLHYVGNMKLLVIYIVVILSGFCMNNNLIKILLGSFVFIYVLMGLKSLYNQDVAVSPIYHIIKDAESYNEDGIAIHSDTEVTSDVTETIGNIFDMDAISKWNSMIPIAE